MIRSFDWRDFPTLHRYRDEGLWLDQTRALTWWLSLVPAGALLASIAPATGIFTYVANSGGEDNSKVIGQLVHTSGSQFAQLAFLAPSSAVQSHGAMALLDHLTVQAGEHGAKNILAEVEEISGAYEVLRRVGYAIYTRQRIWKIEENLDGEAPDTEWRTADADDEHALRHLYSSLVPPLVQQAEPPPWEDLRGMSYWQGDLLKAYVQLTYGPKGIMIQPFVHPEVEHVKGKLLSLIQQIPRRRSRPVYFCVRTHQAWLDSAMNALGAECGPRQAVMVKRMAITKKVTLPLKLPNAGIDSVQPEVSIRLNE